jgi:hypothetical protein
MSDYGGNWQLIGNFSPYYNNARTSDPTHPLPQPNVQFWQRTDTTLGAWGDIGSIYISGYMGNSGFNQFYAPPNQASEDLGLSLGFVPGVGGSISGGTWIVVATFSWQIYNTAAPYIYTLDFYQRIL